MPVLPIIDLLILLGWTALMAGGVLKAVHITTAYRPTIFSLSPFDFVIIAGVFMLFALTLAARTWVKLNEPHLRFSARRGTPSPDAYNDSGIPGPPSGSPLEPDASGSEQTGQVYDR